MVLRMGETEGYVHFFLLFAQQSFLNGINAHAHLEIFQSAENALRVKVMENTMQPGGIGLQKESMKYFFDTLCQCIGRHTNTSHLLLLRQPDCLVIQGKSKLTHMVCGIAAKRIMWVLSYQFEKGVSMQSDMIL